MSLYPEVEAFLNLKAKQRKGLSHPGQSVVSESDPGEVGSHPWWVGTVCLSGNYRLKETAEGGVKLQQEVTDTGGRRRRWLDRTTVAADASDDC